MSAQKWSDANAACQSIGGYLPLISSDIENQELANMSQVVILFSSSTTSSLVSFSDKYASLILMLFLQ